MFLVVGGHSRNIGKTAVAAGLIRALPQADWTALKISANRHRQDLERPYILTEGKDASGSQDTCRYLAAGDILTDARC